MTRTNFGLKGAKEMMKKMEVLTEKQIKASLRRGVKSALPVLLYNVSARIPIDTGELINKMETYGPKTKWKKGQENVHAGVMTPTREALGIDADDPNYWPAALEYGSKAHKITKKGEGMLGGVFRKTVNHPGTAPVSFMRNGAAVTEKAFGKIVGDDINKTIKRAEKKLNRGN